MIHMEHEMSIQIKVAPARASDAAKRGINHQQTPAKATRPMLPMAAPKASSAAASVPRRPPFMPFFCFLFRSCFSIKVALAGNMAGKARKSPPTPGPHFRPAMPARTVMLPPATNRRAYSCHLVCFSPEGSILMVIAYLKKMLHSPKAVRNHSGTAERVAAIADSRNLLRSWLTRILYRQSPAAPAIIERHSVPAYVLPSFEIASARVARATDGAAPNNPAKVIGLKRPPTVANADTTNPPIRKRASESLKAATLDSYSPRFLGVRSIC